MDNLTNNTNNTGAPADGNDADSPKCCYRSCRVKGAVKQKCAASNCNKEVHLMCYQALLPNKHNLESIIGRAVCTKKCYERTMRDLSGGGEEQEEGGRTGRWDCDGKEGSEELTSVRILINWWKEEGNYSKFCGKRNEGVKKIHYANALAEKMSNKTTSKRDGKTVLNKIQHIERSWRLAHDFATSETGAGIIEKDGDTRFRDLVTRKCPFYYQLLDVVCDRASSEPACTSYEADEEEANSEEEDCPNATSFSDISEDEEGGISVATKQTATMNSSRKTSSSKKKKFTLIDHSAIAALTAGNKAMTRQMEEQARHNKVVEAVESRRVALEEEKEKREAVRLSLEQDKFNSMAWKGKNDELNFKMNLLSKYEDLKRDNGWSDEQIVTFFPDMQQVVEAKRAAQVPRPFLTQQLTELTHESAPENLQPGESTEDDTGFPMVFHT
jgi:hypothetical protein